MQAAAELCTSRGIPVEATPFDLTYGELDLKVQVDAQAGAKPDVVLQGLNQLIPLDSNDFVVDLTPLANGDELVNDDTIPVLEAGRINGKQLIVPWGISIPAVFVNTDIAASAGVDLDSLVSWDAIEDASAAIAESADNVYGIAFPLQEGWVPLQYLLTAGTELIDGDNAPVFNDDAGDLAIEHINRLYSSGGAFPGDESASREAFASGEVGLFIASSSFIQQFADTSFEWTTVPFPPVEEGGDVVTGAGGAGLAIFADPDRQAAAWEVVKCALDAEILATYAVETIGYLPVRSDIESSLEPGLLDSAPYAAPWSQFGLAGPWLNFPGDDGPRALARFNEAWVEATQQSSNPTAVMDAAAAEIAGLLP
ncbi:MAG: ABC transporter substrate-binding protein [Ilumatobacter sp.]|uniref:ABC transporter substrate-binding protein n=1 Tax=Ilumatobacter sp. TaxID=1967498 RepID=UPI00391DF577